MEDVHYSLVVIGTTGAVRADHLYPSRASSSNLWLKRELQNLHPGGYIVDLRPLADHPKINSWVYRCPLSNGRIEGSHIDRFSEEGRRAAADMLFGLEGAFQELAFLAASRDGEPDNGDAGPFDEVSASYLARYWGSVGARVGKRVGDVIAWSDGEQQSIQKGEEHGKTTR